VRVFVATFADRDSLYLHALAACVYRFSGRPLFVLGLSGRRAPRHASRWSIERQAVSGVDPGKLKKLWFLGALLEQQSPLLNHSGDSIADDDLFFFVDGFDVLIQRPLAELPAVYQLLQTRLGAPADSVFVMGEHTCWPWPQAGIDYSRRGRRPRGLSMGYMLNASFRVAGGVRSRLLPARHVCDALRDFNAPGRWAFPNSGVWVGSLRGARVLLERLRQLVLQGHFEDQGILGLAMLQDKDQSIRVDVNGSLFTSQYAYNGKWWERPACFDGYFDVNGNPPAQLATGTAPFAMHFNGPPGARAARFVPEANTVPPTVPLRCTG
jgi:hypothetical protein